MRLTVLFLAELTRVDSASLRTFDLARSLAARGVEVETVASGGAMTERYRRANLPLEPYRRIGRAFLPYISNRRIIQLAQFISPDVVHACNVRLSRLAARLARACRARYVVTVNNTTEPHRGIRRSRRCRGVITHSQSVREWLVNNVDIPKEIIAVIPNGVEVDPFSVLPAFEVPPAPVQPADASPPPAPQRRAPVVGMISQSVAGEGHEQFVEAAAAIAARLPDAHFVIAGEGTGRFIRERLQQLGLAHRTTLVPHFADYRQVLASLDVLMVPSVAEGHSRLILDAMACRRPVVATGIGENYEIIRDGETGLLVHRKDAQALAEKTVALLTDARLRESIIRGGFECVRNDFSLARFATDMITYYGQVIGD